MKRVLILALLAVSGCYGPAEITFHPNNGESYTVNVTSWHVTNSDGHCIRYVDENNADHRYCGDYEVN